MRHARTDYNRIQDPAANPELLRAYHDAMRAVARGPVYVEQPAPSALELTAELRDAYKLLARLTRALHPTLRSIVDHEGEHLPAHPIDDDEPVFILRARDRFAPECIEHWCGMLYRSREETDGGDARRAVMYHADAMKQWAAQRGGAKTPDVPPGALEPFYVALANGGTAPSTANRSNSSNRDADGQRISIDPNDEPAPSTYGGDGSAAAEDLVGERITPPATAMSRDVARQIEGTNGGIEPR
jgi:hypothetical protein